MSPWWMKPAQEDRRDSEGKLIALGSFVTIGAALSLVTGFLKFSDGKVWVGALYSVWALLLGFLGTKGFREGWRRWRAKR